jgi:hypothetical protein
VQRAADEAERQRLWYARKKAFGAMGRLAPDVLVQDACVPRSKLPQALRACYDTAARYDLMICNTFHAGDGNLHPTILFDRRDADQVTRVEHASMEMMKACVDLGGTMTGEHGVGYDKKDKLPLVYPEGSAHVSCAMSSVPVPIMKILPVRACGMDGGPMDRAPDRRLANQAYPAGAGGGRRCSNPSAEQAADCCTSRAKGGRLRGSGSRISRPCASRVRPAMTGSTSTGRRPDEGVGRYHGRRDLLARAGSCHWTRRVPLPLGRSLLR